MRIKQIIHVDPQLGLAGLKVAMRGVEFERAKRQRATREKLHARLSAANRDHTMKGR